MPAGYELEKIVDLKPDPKENNDSEQADEEGEESQDEEEEEEEIPKLISAKKPVHILSGKKRKHEPRFRLSIDTDELDSDNLYDEEEERNP